MCVRGTVGQSQDHLGRRGHGITVCPPIAFGELITILEALTTKPLSGLFGRAILTSE